MSQGTDRAKIQKLIKGYEEESKNLIKEISTISVWSENNIDSIWMMSHEERSILADVIREKLETLYPKPKGK